jgi:hypothetical protein
MARLEFGSQCVAVYPWIGSTEGVEERLLGLVTQRLVLLERAHKRVMDRE